MCPKLNEDLQLRQKISSASHKERSVLSVDQFPRPHRRREALVFTQNTDTYQSKSLKPQEQVTLIIYQGAQPMPSLFALCALVLQAFLQKHMLTVCFAKPEIEEIEISYGPVFQSKEEVIEILNGFLCRTVYDIVDSFKRFFTHRHQQCYLIMIETTGLVGPAPIVPTVFVNEVIQEHLEPDAIVASVDARHTLEPERLMEERPQGVENVAIEHVFADVWAIKKTDLVTPEELGALRSELKVINVFAKTCYYQQSRVPVDRVINTGAFDLQKTISFNNAFLDTHIEHLRDKSVNPVGIDVDCKLFGKKLNQVRINLLTTKGADIFRSKSSLSCVDDDRNFVFQGVQMIFKISTTEMSDMQLKNWQKIINKLIFIGKKCNLSEIENLPKSCIFSVKLPGPGPATAHPLHLNSGDSVLCKEGTSEPSVAPVSQSSKGKRRSMSSDSEALHLAGAIEPIIQLSATSQRCFNSQTFICGLLMVLVFISSPFGFVWMKSAQECFKFPCNNSFYLHLAILISTSSFTECTMFNFAVTFLLCVMVSIASFLDGVQVGLSL